MVSEVSFKYNKIELVWRYMRENFGHELIISFFKRFIHSFIHLYERERAYTGGGAEGES